GRRRTIRSTGAPTSPMPTRRGSPRRADSTRHRRRGTSPGSRSGPWTRTSPAPGASTTNPAPKPKPRGMPPRRNPGAFLRRRGGASPRWPRSPARSRCGGSCARAGPHTPRPPRPDKTEGGFRLVIKSDFEPKGDQPQAITDLVKGVQANERSQVLLGVTGSGKTYTMAKVIEQTQRPALILAPNKTLAAQL